MSFTFSSYMCKNSPISSLFDGLPTCYCSCYSSSNPLYPILLVPVFWRVFRSRDSMIGNESEHANIEGIEYVCVSST